MANYKKQNEIMKMIDGINNYYSLIGIKQDYYIELDDEKHEEICSDTGCGYDIGSLTSFTYLHDSIVNECLNIEEKTKDIPWLKDIWEENIHYIMGINYIGKISEKIYYKLCDRLCDKRILTFYDYIDLKEIKELSYIANIMIKKFYYNIECFKLLSKKTSIYKFIQEDLLEIETNWSKAMNEDYDQETLETLIDEIIPAEKDEVPEIIALDKCGNFNEYSSWWRQQEKLKLEG